MDPSRLAATGRGWNRFLWMENTGKMRFSSWSDGVVLNTQRGTQIDQVQWPTVTDQWSTRPTVRNTSIHPPWIFSRYRPRVRGPGPGLIWEYFLSRLTGSWEVDALQVKYIVGMYSRKYSTLFFRGRPANFPISARSTLQKKIWQLSNGPFHLKSPWTALRSLRMQSVTPTKDKLQLGLE